MGTKSAREGWVETIAALGPDAEDYSDWLDMPGPADDDWDWPEDFPWPEEPSVLAFTLLPPAV